MQDCKIVIAAVQMAQSSGSGSPSSSYLNGMHPSQVGCIS